MKTYRLYGSFLSRSVMNAIGAEPHINQGDVLIVADSKREALDMALSRKIMTTMRDPNFRLAGGRMVEALDAAGLLARRRVLAYDNLVGDYLVEIAADGTATRIGRVAGGVFVRLDDQPS